ncbi:MAG: DUF1572 family protein [Acidobacteria bacterium]|nr:DUF1572 family protein [Acidobacteriota bacterium]
MLNDILTNLYERDLNKLKTEIDMFPDEADLWKTKGDITNSAGNLCLHLIGNLRHFFGAVLGGTGYVRDRDSEFSTGGVSKTELLAGVDTALADVLATLAGLTDDDFANTYPIEVFDRPLTTGAFLTHLATHLNYHLGQINYHRRMTSGS